MPQGNTLRSQSRGLLAMLALQYALGMYANLFISFPDGVQGGAAWVFAWSQWVIAAHIILGLLLVIASITFLVRAVRAERMQMSGWKTPAIWGIVGIGGALVAGPQFISSQNNAWSYAMSLFFVISFFAYLWAYVAHREQK